MAHRLNTNKQFMIGNGILAAAIIFVVVIFVYMSLRFNKEQQEHKRYYTEVYTIAFEKGFMGDSTSIYINDSLLLNKTINEEPFCLEIPRFDEQSTLMIVDNATEELAIFELSTKGGEYRFEKENGEVKQLSRKR